LREAKEKKKKRKYEEINCEKSMKGQCQCDGMSRYESERERKVGGWALEIYFVVHHHPFVEVG
jgi:hypothetical protein